jgi:hypothetical protein
MIPVPEAFNVLGLFLKTVQEVNQDDTGSPKREKFLKFLSISFFRSNTPQIF